MTHRDILYMALQNYLNSQKWNFMKNPELFAAVLKMGLDHSEDGCSIVCQALADGISSCAAAPRNVPPDRYAVMLDYLNRVNFRLPNGHFEMSPKDGSVRFRTFLPAKEAIPDMADIERCVDTTYLMINEHSAAFDRLIDGTGDPESLAQAAFDSGSETAE